MQSDNAPGALAGIIPGADGLPSLTDALRRVARARTSRAALVLHLSRLRAPAPRPHHHRIARAILNEAAQRHGGQLFTLGNGDMVLLCETSILAAPAGQGPADMLATLFRPDAPDSAPVARMSNLPNEAAMLEAYVAERAGDPAPRKTVTAGPRAPLSPVDDVTPGLDVTEMIFRRLVVRLDQGRGGLSPDHERVGIGMEALVRRYPSRAAALEDGFIRQHLRALLAPALMQAVTRTLLTRRISPQDTGPVRGHLPLQIELGAAGVLALGFAEFARDCARFRPDSQIVLGLQELCAEPEQFYAACARIRAEGMGLMLHVGPIGSLLLVQPRMISAGLLQPDAIAVEWDERLAKGLPGDRAAVEAALRLLPLQRVILAGAESEAAMLWGAVRNVPRFEGRHVDLLLATQRLENLRRDAARSRIGEPMAQAGALHIPPAYQIARLNELRAAELRVGELQAAELITGELAVGAFGPGAAA